MASRLVFEIRVVSAATNAQYGFGYVQRGIAQFTKRRGGPFPNVADELVDAADAGAARILFDGHRALFARAVQVGAADVERFAPRVAALSDAPWSGLDRPGTRLSPFGIGGQSLSNPARIGPSFVPTDADDG